MKQLTPLDAQFFYSDAPHQPMVIGSLWICDQRSAPNGLVRHKDIIGYFSSRLSSTSLFRRRLQHAPFRLDDPYWVEDKNFDLEYHIRHVGLPQPGDWRQLCIFTARAMSRTLDMERAPWELTIIEGLNNIEGVPPGSFALLLRFHHSYIDGKAGVEINNLLMSDQPEFDENTYRQPFGERMPSRAQMWARTVPRLATQPLRSLRASVGMSKASLRLIRRMRGEDRPTQKRIPTTLFNTQVSPHRTFGGLSWKISELKQVRRCAEGATLNDVIIAIIGGGLRHYLQRREALPDIESLVALCPVAMPPDQDQRQTGNLLSGMLIGVGTDIEDPVERLQAILERTRSGTGLARDVVHELIVCAGDLVPAPMRMLGGWMGTQLRYTGKYHLANTLITNVPGPTGGTDRKYVAGAELLALYPIPPVFDGMALCHGITSLYGELILGVVSDRNVLPDMDVYIDCIQQSTEQYLALARQSAQSPAPKVGPQSSRKRAPAATSSTEEPSP
ncbi:wax ester/triacylglycerol synthase family O-acyltransferase [Pseudomonas izuensis]|uniref:wax ester/triacylglycerol synthase family O-acyltransferase n=1 Tax=Pseudomonas izuensis TaxID=2684212 RepID=UPI00135A1E54|nr:wax ester/triacylglycerol synthase family O-acyltransferase [Pseudomonas izuensis]